MDIKTLENFKLSDAIVFHEQLNPKLFVNNHLRPEVKNQLLLIAKDFLTELGVNDLAVQDITVSGSNAAYSYTPHSDLDLHILVDLGETTHDEIYQELFNAKKTIYNDTHEITVHGVPVELYVQDSNKPVISLGEYSILHNKWLRIPTKRRANFDQTASKSKYDQLKEIIELALKSDDIKKVNKVLKKIRRYRQSGLDKGGEFGPENLAYKALRSQGYITKLYKLRDKLHSAELTIETMYAQEDYHPNAKPRGPEFKPTMPKGTVRVDVSDVYDWYKLGQHISNMKGLGKHDFGKGPPSTVLSFGDEDTEHKYIDYLKKTGLDTTDIDPKAHDTKKGQKVDPTYNVNENKSPTYVYHVTPTKNLKSIAKQGLVPTVGDRTSQIQGEKSGIYVFPDRVSVEDAVMNWLGDEFDDEPLTMLKIDVTGLQDHISKGADYELIVGTTIEPNRIKKLNVQLEEASGYIPSEKEKNDPRYCMALTVDVHPNTMKKDAKKFGNTISRAGIPPTLQPSGKF